MTHAANTLQPFSTHRGGLQAVVLVLLILLWPPIFWKVTQQQSQTLPHWEVTHHPLSVLSLPAVQTHLHTQQDQEDEPEAVLVMIPAWQPTLPAHRQIYTRQQQVRGPPVPRIRPHVLYQVHQMDPP